MKTTKQVLADAAGKFDTSALAILSRCAQSGVHLRVDGGHLKAKGDRETIAAWNPLIQRHKPEIIAALTGQPSTTEAGAKELATLAADYAELTACIIELCQLAGYTSACQGWGVLEYKRTS